MNLAPFMGLGCDSRGIYAADWGREVFDESQSSK